MRNDIRSEEAESSLYLEKQSILNAALSYKEDDLINILPQLNVLFKQRRSAAEIVHKGNANGWEIIEMIDNQIQQLLGLKK